MIFLSSLASDIIPLTRGIRWLYRVESRIISIDVKAEVSESKNDYRLIRFAGEGLNMSVILKSGVDISIMGYNTGKEGSLSDTSSFRELSGAVILKSPVETGSGWYNSFGRFYVADSNYSLKSGNRVFNGCIHLHLDDSQNTGNDFYLKDGYGLLYARLFIDKLGKVDVNLRKFN